MPKRLRQNPTVASLIAEVLRKARDLPTPITAQEMARRIGVTPETLSRMKTRGIGDAAVIADMAAVVGFRLTLVNEDNVKAKILSGGILDAD